MHDYKCVNRCIKRYVNKRMIYGFMKLNKSNVSIDIGIKGLYINKQVGSYVSREGVYVSYVCSKQRY